VGSEMGIRDGPGGGGANGRAGSQGSAALPLGNGGVRSQHANGGTAKEGSSREARGDKRFSIVSLLKVRPQRDTGQEDTEVARDVALDPEDSEKGQSTSNRNSAHSNAATLQMCD